MTTAIRAIPGQYATGATRERIKQALLAVGKDPETLTASDLAPLEDFHSLGRLATGALVELAGIGPEDRVLDAGAGIGGTARLIAHQIGCRVTAVDITPDYCTAAEWLTDAVGLGDRIDVREADVLELPFAADSFDVIVSQHVQMNIADKPRLYAEARRLLTRGGRLAVWDVTAGPVQPLRYPVPWADDPELSHLVSPQALQQIVEDAGFDVKVWNDLTEPSAEAMRRFVDAGPAPLGLHVFVPDFATKAANLVANLEQDRARLVQAVLVAR